MIDVVREVSAFKPIDLARIPEKYKPSDGADAHGVYFI